MIHLKLRTKLLILIFLTTTAAISLTYEAILRKIGQFRVYEQQPQKADVIVVLNGRDTERALAAVDLYNQGYAKLIVLARGPKQPGSDEFYKRVGKNFDNKIFFQKALEAMGISKHSFKLIGNGITSTYDEANVIKDFLTKTGYNSILLVTSKWHSKRAYLTFSSVLGQQAGIQITVCPSKYDTFNATSWWRNRGDIEFIFYEYLRLFYYLITFRIEPYTKIRSTQ